MPKSTVPIIGTLAKHLRRACAEHLFAECSPLINVEQGVYFGNGKQIRVLGENVGLGKNFTCHCRILTMHSHIMMGEDLLFQGSGYGYDNPAIYVWMSRKDYYLHHWRYVKMYGSMRVV